MTITDARPTNCRFRMQDEGRPYPKSGCEACSANIVTGLVCPIQPPAQVGAASMTQVTDADRDAAQALCASGWTHAIQAFARHREQAVQEAVAGIVAWLRSDAQSCDCFAKSASECGCGAWDTEPGERSYKRVTEEDIADAIERGDWK